jgi:hypothetical protein
MLAQTSIPVSRGSRKILISLALLLSPLLISLLLLCGIVMLAGAIALAGETFTLLCCLLAHVPASIFILPALGVVLSCYLKGAYHAAI